LERVDEKKKEIDMEVATCEVQGVEMSTKDLVVGMEVA
jgi:hypothetical protein